jgi:hypothetical protein
MPPSNSAPKMSRRCLAVLPNQSLSRAVRTALASFHVAVITAGTVAVEGFGRDGGLSGLLDRR